MRRIHHVACAVLDTEAAVAEYERLGYRRFRSFRSRSTPAEVTLMTHPVEVGVELFQFDDLPSSGAARLRNHIAFETDAIEREAAHRVKAGWRVVRDIGPGVPVRRLCFLEDHAGNLVEIVEPWQEELAARAR